MQYDNKNSGALFKNDKKEKDSHPDYRGTIDVNGTEFWLSAWIKSSKAGVKYMSLAVQPKEEKRGAERPAPERRAAPAQTFDDSDIPF